MKQIYILIWYTFTYLLRCRKGGSSKTGQNRYREVKTFFFAANLKIHSKCLRHQRFIYTIVLMYNLKEN